MGASWSNADALLVAHEERMKHWYMQQLAAMQQNHSQQLAAMQQNHSQELQALRVVMTKQSERIKAMQAEMERIYNMR